MNFDTSFQNRRQEDPQRADPLTPAPVVKKPRRQAPRVRPGGLRGRCWWLMREVTTFTINQLLDTYADGSEKNPHINLRGYLAQLEACGVVERLQRRQPGDSLFSHGLVVWRLKRDLGLFAPIWMQREKVLWDPNRQEIVTPVSAETAPPIHPETSAND